MEPTKFILYSKRGGWFTSAAGLHSDWRKAAEYEYDDAIDMVRLHSGVLIPVEKSLYIEAMKGVKE